MLKTEQLINSRVVNINPNGDYLDAHNQLHSYLSGIHYLKVPAVFKKFRNLSGVWPSYITFCDLHSIINMNLINIDPYMDPKNTVLLKNGELLMWSAFLNHFVHPKLRDKTRISISFIIILKYSDYYLPKK